MVSQEDNSPRHAAKRPTIIKQNDDGGPESVSSFVIELANIPLRAIKIAKDGL